MPAVLVLFAIALVITLIGVFLSPKSQTPQIQDRRRVASAGARATRTAPASASQRVRRVSEILEPGETIKPLRPRASQKPARTRLAEVPRAQQAASISIDNGLWGRLSGWKVAVPGLAAIFLLSFYLLNVAGPRPLLWTPSFFGSTGEQATPLPTATTPTYTATQHLARLGQLDPAQYRSTQEYKTWSYSACSAASMTEVINAYGHNYRVTDILTVESRIHEITPQDGLLEEVGIQNTGKQFGFKTVWGHNFSLDQVIAAANHGTPVIVSFPPYKYPPGHILVVRGGNASTVYLADSSRLNWTQLTRARFMQLWGGFYAIMTPN